MTNLGLNPLISHPPLAPVTMHCVRANLAHPPPKPKWSVADMPVLSGKVMIVTGGNAGIGKETVKVGALHMGLHHPATYAIVHLGIARARGEGVHGGEV